MEGKELCAVLLLAMGLLPTGHAGFLGSGMHDLPNACNETHVRSCLPPFMESGVLAPFTSGNDITFDMAGAASPDLKAEVCDTFQSAVACLQVVESPCYNGSLIATFTELLVLDYNVPRVPQLLDLWRQMCTCGAQSLAGVSLMTVLLLTCLSLL